MGRGASAWPDRPPTPAPTGAKTPARPTPGVRTRSLHVGRAAQMGFHIGLQPVVQFYPGPQTFAQHPPCRKFHYGVDFATTDRANRPSTNRGRRLANRSARCFGPRRRAGHLPLVQQCGRRGGPEPTVALRFPPFARTPGRSAALRDATPRSWISRSVTTSQWGESNLKMRQSIL